MGNLLAPERLKVEQGGGLSVITLLGPGFGRTEEVTGRTLEKWTEEMGSGLLLLDFRNVESIYSSDLGVLIRIHQRSRAQGGRLILFNLSPWVYEIFTVTRLHTLLEICRENHAPGA